jgi:hypothetical protein
MRDMPDADAALKSWHKGQKSFDAAHGKPLLKPTPTQSASLLFAENGVSYTVLVEREMQRSVIVFLHAFNAKCRRSIGCDCRIL